MKKEIIKYGLKLKGQEEPLKYGMIASDPEEDFCTDIQYHLCEYGENFWLVDTITKALYAMYNPQKYYNAEYDTPEHYYKPEELEVVKIKQIIETDNMELKFVKIKLKDDIEDLIPNYIDNYKKDTFYMKGETGIALDKGDYYQIVNMEGVQCNIENESTYDKKYFQVIE